MFVGISMAMVVVAGVQPVCTSIQFKRAFGESLQGEQKIVATAIHNDYLAHYQKLKVEDGSGHDSPTKKLGNRFALTKQADQLFDELLESLSILNNSRAWKRSLIDLRRTVLLRARRSDNPWSSTIWVDLSSFMTLRDDRVFYEIDAFLIGNIDDDREDRFEALLSSLEGDEQRCAEITQRAMHRWGEYQKIIDPHMTKQLEPVIYPQLDLNNQVYDVMEWIELHITDENSLSRSRNQFSIWSAVHSRQQKELISLVRTARTELGFDPWSRGCGHPNSSTATSLKNKLLQGSAEIVELNRSTYNAILQQLSPEQRIQFDEHQ